MEEDENYFQNLRKSSCSQDDEIDDEVFIRANWIKDAVSSYISISEDKIPSTDWETIHAQNRLARLIALPPTPNDVIKELRNMYENGVDRARTGHLLRCIECGLYTLTQVASREI